jgi:hypothetical protein
MDQTHTAMIAYMDDSLGGPFWNRYCGRNTETLYAGHWRTSKYSKTDFSTGRTTTGIPQRQETKIPGGGGTLQHRLRRQCAFHRWQWRKRTKCVARETYLRTLCLSYSRISSFSRNSGMTCFPHSQERDTNCNNGNVVTTARGGISRSTFCASKAGSWGWNWSDSYCC